MSNPPSAEQIEVTILGPGYGEAIVIHVGGGRWVIIDSCVDPRERHCLPLHYLDGLGVSVGSQVDLVVASHWHDDHVRGLSDVVSACRGADFCLSSVMTEQEFIAHALALAGAPPMKGGSGVAEATKLLTIMMADKGRRRFVYAASNKLIKRLSALPHGFDVEIWSLSPSDEEYKTFIRQIGQQMELFSPISRVVSHKPNNCSVVIWVRIGPVAVLLGGDLEDRSGALCGWCAIVSSAERPVGRADLFKIPHHGSSNAHNLNVWQRMLHPQADAVVTPYRNGSTRLPTSADVSRITSLSPNALITSTSSGSVVRRVPAVERTLREMKARVAPLYLKPGRVTYRTAPSAGPTVWEKDYSPEAGTLTSFPG